MPDNNLLEKLDALIAENEAGLRDQVKRDLVETQQKITASTAVAPPVIPRGERHDLFETNPEAEAQRSQEDLLIPMDLGQSDVAARVPGQFRHAQAFPSGDAIGSRDLGDDLLDLGRHPGIAAKQFALSAAKGATGGLVSPPGLVEGRNAIAETAGKLTGELFPLTKLSKAVSVGSRAVGLTGKATTRIGKIVEMAVEDFITGFAVGGASPSEGALSTGAAFASLSLMGRTLAMGVRSAGGQAKHIEDFFLTERGAAELTGAFASDRILGKALTPARTFIEATRELSRRLVGQAKSHISSPQGKRFLGTIDAVDHKASSRAASALEQMRVGKLASLSKEEANVFDAMLKGEILGSDDAAIVMKAWRGQAKHVANLAKKLGVKIRRPDGSVVPFEEAANFFPRMTKRSIAQEVGNDVERLVKEAGIKLTPDGRIESKLSDATIQKLTKLYNESGGISARTKAGVAHHIKKGHVKSPGEAIALLERTTYNDVYSPMSNLEYSRSAPHPNDWYETDARKVIPRYLVGAFKRLAEIEAWGQDFAKGSAMLRGISGTEEKVIMEMVANYTGAASRRSTMSPEAKAVLDDFIAFEVGTKIGLGTATIPNITQSLISTIPKVGVYRTLRGVAKVLTPAGRAEVRKTGATLAEAMQTFSGLELGGHGVAKQFATFSTTIFRAVNKANKYVAAASMKVYVHDLHKLANTEGTRQKWAKEMLGKLGVQWDQKLKVDGVRRAMFNFAKQSQLQRDVLRDPNWMNNPALRPLGLFHRFGLRQAAFIKDQVVSELETGNVFPILRLVAGGIIGGEMVIWARNQIKEGISGRPTFRQEDVMWQRVINDLAAAGAMGVMTDMMQIDDLETALPDIVQSMGFAATPVLIAEGISVGAALTSFGNDVRGGFSVKDAARRQAVRLGGRVGGPMIRAASERFETVRQKLGRLTGDKSRAKAKAQAMVRRGNGIAAQEFVDEWNRKNAQRFVESGVWEERFGTPNDRFEVEPLELTADDIESSEDLRAKKKAVP